MLNEFIRLNYNKSFTEKAKHSRDKKVIRFTKDTLGWGYITYSMPGDEKSLNGQKSFRTYQSFFSNIDDPLAVYFTPNTFCSRYKRQFDKLRWLNSFFIDIDDNEISILDINDRLTDAGLPYPTLINKTPGGWHLFWVFDERIPATPKAKWLYNYIQKHMAIELGADTVAVGAERIIRIPRNIQYFDKENTIPFSVFVDWLHINIEAPEERQGKYIRIDNKNIFDSEPVKKLLEGVEHGYTNIACFCLAVCYKNIGYTFDEVLNELVAWNKRNEKPLLYKELLKTVKSAYKKDYAIPVSKIKEITGMKLPQSFFWYKHKKDRKDRERNHYEEWIADIVNFLRNNNYKWEGSQRELAELINAPIRSLKEALKRLREGKIKSNINIKVEGKGRGAKTILELVIPKAIHINKHKIAFYKNLYMTKERITKMNKAIGIDANNDFTFTVARNKGSP